MLVSRVKDIELPNRRNVFLDEREIEYIKTNWNNTSRDYMLDELNVGRIRKISRQRLYRAAIALGLHKGKFNLLPGYNSVIKSKLTFDDKRLIRKQYSKGIAIDTILSLVNMKKDLKVSEEEINAFIERWQYRQGKTKYSRKLTPDEHNYILEHKEYQSYSKMLEVLNENREVKLSWFAIHYALKKQGKNDGGTGSIRFTRNEIEYLRRNYQKESAAEICEFFNKSRRRRMHYSCIQRQLKKMGLSRVFKLQFTDTEIQFIKDNYQRYSGRELAAVMNSMRSDKRVSQTTIRFLLKKLGLKRTMTEENMSQFRKGHKTPKRQPLI